MRITVESPDGPARQLSVASHEHSLALSGVLAAHGFPLNTRCNGRGLCRGCKVEVDGVAVRACAVPPADGVTVRIPGRSRLEHRPQVNDSFRIEIPYARRPLFNPAPGLRDTAFAVDLGTTTVAVLLVDLTTGEVLARAGAFNEQIRFGDNVVTRIDAARAPGALAAMQSAAAATVAALLRQAGDRAGRALSRLAGGVVAGNTTMLHLLVGADPAPLGVAPFTPRFLDARRVTAGELGLAGVEAGLPVRLLPGIAAYIGADITAGVCATGMRFDEQPSLLVDIGTNGEIVLQCGGRLTACATAAGPAFEGSGLRCGGRARAGAVSGIALALDPFRLEAATIGGVPPGRADAICGSAYIDFLAAGRRCGLLNEAGRFAAEVWRQIPDDRRLEVDGGKALRVAGEACISEADVAVLLPAKAAVGAGIETLLSATGIKAGEIARVYLAGGFGLHLDAGHAIAVGLLPGFRAEQVRAVGNTALAGALLALTDRTALEEMEAWRGGVAVLELNLQEGFEDCFVDHLSLP
jgi:uncharacterized 2Fe-2S/4Fe-4S cluster protein (DUF4445 family)